MGKSYIRQVERTLTTQPHRTFTGKELLEASGAVYRSGDGTITYGSNGVTLRDLLEGRQGRGDRGVRPPMADLHCDRVTRDRDGRTDWLNSRYTYRPAPVQPVVDVSSRDPRTGYGAGSPWAPNDNAERHGELMAVLERIAEALESIATTPEIVREGKWMTDAE